MRSAMQATTKQIKNKHTHLHKTHNKQKKTIDKIKFPNQTTY